MRTRTILIACLAIATFNGFGASVEVSSKIELDSDERADISSYLALDTTDLSESTSSSESVLRTQPKQQAYSRHRGSELVKARETRKRRIDTLREDSSSQPKVINNIQIVVNSNDSMSSTNSCKHGICDVSVSSQPDGKGNIVTQVHLTIITSAKPDTQIGDVPVIDGFRGADKDPNERPIFHPIMTPNPVYSYLRRDNIPQIQTNYRDYGGTWYQHQRISQRPRTYYHYFEDHNNVGSRGYRTWQRDGPVVDDKIGSPLSKTANPTTT